MKTLLILLVVIILLLVIATLAFRVVDLWLDEWDLLKDRWKERHKGDDDG